MEKKSGILNWKTKMRALAMMVCLALTLQSASGCGTTEPAQSTQEITDDIEEKTQEQTDTEEQEKSLPSTENATTIKETFDFAAIPADEGKAYVAVNGNSRYIRDYSPEIMHSLCGERGTESDADGGKRQYRRSKADRLAYCEI